MDFSKELKNFIGIHRSDVSKRNWNKVLTQAQIDRSVSPKDIVEAFLLDIWGDKPNAEDIMFHGCVKIPDNACAGSSRITQFSVPDSIISLGNEVFRDCVNLTTVDLGNIASLGNGCFEGCKKLRQIKLSDNLTEIPENCFSGCSQLRKVIIPKSVTKIGSNAFQKCDKVLLLFENEDVDNIWITEQDAEWLQSGNHVAIYDSSTNSIQPVDIVDDEEQTNDNNVETTNNEE